MTSGSSSRIALKSDGKEPRTRFRPSDITGTVPKSRSDEPSGAQIETTTIVQCRSCHSRASVNALRSAPPGDRFGRMTATRSGCGGFRGLPCERP